MIDSTHVLCHSCQFFVTQQCKILDTVTIDSEDNDKAKADSNLSSSTYRRNTLATKALIVSHKL